MNRKPYPPTKTPTLAGAFRAAKVVNPNPSGVKSLSYWLRLERFDLFLTDNTEKRILDLADQLEAFADWYMAKAQKLRAYVEHEA